MTAPYGTTPYGAGPGPVFAPPAQPGRARTALVLVGIAVLLQVSLSVLNVFLPLLAYHFELPVSAYGFFYLPVQIVQILLSVVALILGIGPLRGGGPKGVAGAAVGIAVAFLVTIVAGLVVSYTAPLLY